jgi:hypothetical protein
MRPDALRYLLPLGSRSHDAGFGGPLEKDVYMRRLYLLLACASLFLGSAAAASAQGQPRLFYTPDCQTPPPCGPYHWPQQPAPGMPAQPGQPGQPAPGQMTPSPTGEPYLPSPSFTQAPTQGTAAPESFNANIIGDFPAYFFTPRSPQTGSYSSGGSHSSRIPIVGRVNFKVAENESPRPQTRVFLTYNYFKDITRKFDAFDAKGNDFHSTMLGLEYAFAGNQASIGVRIPYAMLDRKDDGLSEDTHVGDITLTSKFAFYDDPRNGDIISGGCFVTIPTQETGFDLSGEPFRSTLIQPWGGFICNLNECLYIHGFSSVTIPTVSEDASIWFNDIGIGYSMTNPDASFLAAVIPTVELHAANPLSNRGLFKEPVGVTDILDLTVGVHFVTTSRCSLSVGFATPIMGYRLYDWEGMAQLNFRF